MAPKYYWAAHSTLFTIIDSWIKSESFVDLALQESLLWVKMDAWIGASCYFWWIETSVFFFRVKNNCGDKQFCLSVETNDSGATLINQWISSLFFVHRSLRLVFQNWINEMLKWKFLMWQWNRWVTFTFTARWTSWNIVIRTWRLFLGQARLIYDWRARSREKELVKKSSYIPLKGSPFIPQPQPV